MHGIYNKYDQNVIQHFALGRLAWMYRKWVKAGLNRRYKKRYYDVELGIHREGYYNTMWRFSSNIIRDIRNGQFDIVKSFKNLQDDEKHNIIKAARELGVFLVLSLFFALQDFSDDDDEDEEEKSYIANTMEYALRRLKSELGFFTPTPQILTEGLRIVNSPAAGVNILERIIGLFSLMNPMNYETIAGEDALLESGRYEGQSKATKAFLESPFVPMARTFYRNIHPEESIPFYKNELW
jgi:hypothetical protein